ncbi:hypothetical protein Glove_692g38 [Diversispora epigaea]|uniref:Uncharacterized protein n=1 Tax=Diversispora epigaea TaxID=1348612 RepID=A0A397G365_9GLOM|nr:hypothetical protein Glove_692g38 [Diversispora epigaea]
MSEKTTAVRAAENRRVEEKGNEEQTGALIEELKFRLELILNGVEVREGDVQLPTNKRSYPKNFLQIYTNKRFNSMRNKRNTYANSQKAVRQLSLYNSFFPELISQQNSLELYSLCEKHYNQIIAKNNLYKILLNSNEPIYSIQPNNVETQTIEIENYLINTNNLLLPTNKRSYPKNFLQIYTNKRFNSMRNKRNTYANSQKAVRQLSLYNSFFPELISQQNSLELYSLCEKHYNQIIAKNNLYKILLNSNEPIYSIQPNSNNKRIKHSINNSQIYYIILKLEINQQKRINAIIEVVELLIGDASRFLLNNLINYTPQFWLSKKNKVIVKFIETLTSNDQDNDNAIQEKIFKRAVAEMGTVYLMTRDTQSGPRNAGCYTRFLKWLEELTKEQEPLPKGLLSLTFDNEQRGQKTILISQCKDLFNLSFQMRQEFNHELYNYLTKIIEQLCGEKLSATNNIDALIENTLFISYKIFVQTVMNKMLKDENKIVQNVLTVTQLRNETTIEEVVVKCDGVPYHYTIKLKEKFSWLILIPGQLHEYA